MIEETHESITVMKSDTARWNIAKEHIYQCQWLVLDAAGKGVRTHRRACACTARIGWDYSATGP